MANPFLAFYAFPVDFRDIYKKIRNILLPLRISERYITFLCDQHEQSCDFRKIDLRQSGEYTYFRIVQSENGQFVLGFLRLSC